MGCLCEDEADVELWKSEDIVNLYWALTYQYRALEWKRFHKSIRGKVGTDKSEGKQMRTDRQESVHAKIDLEFY
jgi:hypothetical protein